MNHKGSKHINWNKRLTIERMIKVGVSKPKIAEAIGVCLSSVYNELERGMCVQMTSDYEFVERYVPDIAEQKYQANLREKGPDLKIGHDHDFVKRVEDLIVNQGYSPGSALAEIRNSGEVYDTEICEKTLYNYIYRGDVFLTLTPEHLPIKGRRHHPKKNGKKAARPPKGTSIEHRPPEIKERKTFGHWELDSVMGCKGSKSALVVFTERLTRTGIIVRVPDHTSASVVQAINKLERRFGKLFYTLFKSITVDNGCEFQDVEGMQISCRRKGNRTTVYFCHPYSAYERGSNENMNRMIRRFFPKGTNFDNVTATEVKRAEDWLNNYPRKILDWKTPAMLFQRAMAAG